MTRFTNVPGAAVLMGGAAQAASSPAAVSPERDDAQLLADCRCWQELQEQVVAIRRRQREVRRGVPERFKKYLGIDPRGWADGEFDVPLPPAVVVDLREFERLYLSLGLGEMEDELDAVLNERDSFMDRIADAEPRTVAGAFAVARMWMLEAGEPHLVDEDPGEWMHGAVLAGLRALDAGDRLLARGRGVA